MLRRRIDFSHAPLHLSSIRKEENSRKKRSKDTKMRMNRKKEIFSHVNEERGYDKEEKEDRKGKTLFRQERCRRERERRKKENRSF
ncbi:hypothetical protein CSUI_008896 [Cystoisospora suis]|uniref:Uncharacterized protein n=1 Tax=Cystoisospora suis TaxID=483139 RepID=A0A2C6KLI0_9APIC|nr:hypothetical protein CSUI_008896 [Cystoisospora suis]